ncbi:MAG: DUF362 domain-containing protein [Cyanobacteria bacterium NC_groundwater_1444_Ag_S-0.65um_54_12]|nr:DUF362 domain-containing protein [Cyanobacteria bacterium NC_groundwater_1444_Ag_S-0.65um_54_12]
MQRRTNQGGGLLEKMEQLFEAARFSQLFERGDLVATKVQVGERGNTTHLRPELVKRIVRKVHQHGGRPFVTDTGSEGCRGDAVSHTLLAAEHGFELVTLGAPFLVADGLDGQDAVMVRTEGKLLREVPVATHLYRAKAIIAIAHFTAGPIYGWHGALYNLGYLGMARNLRQQPNRELASATKGAGESSGSNGMIPDIMTLKASQRWLVEAFYAIAQLKEQRLGFVNVLVDITPDPDGYPWSDAPIVPDIGILASRDPVALDQASADFVNGQEGLPGTRLRDPRTRDKLADLNPSVDWSFSLAYAEELGLGTRDYELLII